MRTYRLRLDASDGTAVRTSAKLCMDDEFSCADNLAALVLAARRVTDGEGESAGGDDLMLLAAWFVRRMAKEWLGPSEMGNYTGDPEGEERDAVRIVAAKSLEAAATAYIRACKTD